MKGKIVYRLLFIFILVIISTACSKTGNQVPDDYIGTWIFTSKENDETNEDETDKTIEIKFILGLDTLTAEFPDDNFTIEIVSCRKIKNKSLNTGEYYPKGISLSFMESLSETIEIYLSRDKKRIVLPVLIEDDPQFSFIKQ